MCSRRPARNRLLPRNRPVPQSRLGPRNRLMSRIRRRARISIAQISHRARNRRRAKRGVGVKYERLARRESIFGLQVGDAGASHAEDIDCG